MGVSHGQGSLSTCLQRFKKCKNRKCFIFYDECCSRSLPFWIQNTKKEKAHKCLKPKLRNYQQNRVKRFVKLQFVIGLFNLQNREFPFW
ncbi:hypothetical protein Anas_14740 [Armadillidium nasatum]|uniref:Uncharacterized protein n=1 Tax=Armadillidium nasatum TaxID=96803 RepID=A0A5N5SI65_9CRUS|nr:hypothetical protein Anas_14740 [Armadillidium nasatum]